MEIKMIYNYQDSCTFENGKKENRQRLRPGRIQRDSYQFDITENMMHSITHSDRKTGMVCLMTP